MNEMERLDEALRAMRDADATRGAPEFLETRLRAAFREKHAAPRLRWNWIGVFATAAMALLAVWQLSAPVAVQAPTPLARKPQPAATAPHLESEPPVVAQTEPKKRVTPAPRRRNAPVSPPAIDALTAGARDDDFFALPYAPPFAATDRGQVMRVRMPRQALRQLGLPMNEERMFERIPADVLVGEDGIPRAIRIVNVR